MTLFRLSTLLPSLIIAVSAGEDCSCFLRSELENFTADNVNDLMSCRESHYLGSGIGLFIKGENEDDIKGFSVTLDTHMQECMQWDMDTLIPFGSMAEAENCAQMIRDRCAEIDRLPIEV